MLPILAGIVSSLVSNNLPGLAQAVVDKGVSYVEDKLGLPLKPNMSKEEIEALRAESIKHEEFLITKAYEDTASARSMQIAAVNQSDTFTKRFLPILTLVLIVLASIFLGFASFGTFNPAQLNMVNGIVEFVKITFATIVGFWYGSSNGSVRKTDMLNGK